jgi:site-specific DNA-cytosine methylase
VIKTENFIQWDDPKRFESACRAWNPETFCGAIDTKQTITVYEIRGGKMENLKIRKLTPRECWRLMGRADEDFEKAAAVCSESQLNKQAGNSIVVDVLFYLLKNVFEQYPEE